MPLHDGDGLAQGEAFRDSAEVNFHAADAETNRMLRFIQRQFSKTHLRLRLGDFIVRRPCGTLRMKAPQAKQRADSHVKQTIAVPPAIARGKQNLPQDVGAFHSFVRRTNVQFRQFAFWIIRVQRIMQRAHFRRQLTENNVALRCGAFMQRQTALRVEHFEIAHV